MSEIQITDLVPQETIDQLTNLDTKMQAVVVSYTNTAKELAKGLQLEVKVVGDLDKLDGLYLDKLKEFEAETKKLNKIIEEKNAIIANTTNTISRELMEQERVNKTQRDAYTDTERFKSLLEQVNGSYENRIKRLVETEKAIKDSKAREAELEKQLKNNLISQETYTQKMTEQRMVTRELQQEKASLTQHLRNEEKEMQTVEGSYNNLSQRLELMKKAYKDMNEEEKNSALGREMETAIQDLDAHLKDLAADMGEFQRNVGNYAIAGKDGVVSTESLLAVLNQEARTLQEVADQTKILEEGKKRLNPEDANYASTVEQVNAQLATNRERLNDVSDIMDKQATSIAEAEEQNKRLTEALKNIDQTSDDAASRMEALNAKIEENNRIINSGEESKASIKKSLKELVLEIANLTIEYQNLTEEEKNSAEGQALAQHIQELTEKAGVLKDAITDTNQAISNAASDTRGFDQLGGSLQLAIDGFGLATGAAEMFGISSGDLAQIQTKLQAAIAASNAMQSIQNTLQKQSAVMQGVNLAQTKLRTIAENLHTAAQGKGVIATKLLTVAQWAFNAAASANPIGLVVVAITAAIAAVYGLIKAFQAFFGNSEEAIKQYEAQKKGLDDLCDSHDRLIERMKAKGATEAELLEQSLLYKEEEKKAADALFARAQELYDEDEDKYKEALEVKKKADEDFEKSKEDSLNYLRKVIHDSEEEEKKQRLGTYEYKRQLIKAELEQQKAIAATLLAQEKIAREVYENLCASLEKAAQLKIESVNADEQKDNEKKAPSVGGGRTRSRSSGGGGRIRSGSSSSNPVDDLKKETQAAEDALLNLIEDSLARQEQAENNSYRRRRKELEDHLAKTSAKNVAMRKAIEEQIEGLEAEHSQKLAKIYQEYHEREISARQSVIEARLRTAKEGSREELALMQEQENVRMAIELDNIKKMEQEKQVTLQQADRLREEERLYHEQRLLEIRNEYNQKQMTMLQDETASRAIDINNEYMEEVVALKRKFNDELRAAGDNVKKREALQAQYDEDMVALNQVLVERTINGEIEMMEKMIKIAGLSAEERLRIEQELTAKKLELQDKIADYQANVNTDTQNSTQKWLSKNLDMIDAFASAATDMLNSITELMSSIYDGRIQKIEEEEEANQTANEREMNRIDELVNKKVITEEEGEARKRAAEAITAKKEEELAKKKRDLQIKQAKWDKANSIAQATISTALAVLNALQTQPFWLGIAMAAIAGAMGAVQIATIASTPIPAYKEGTEYHKGGLALVGDGGQSEVVQYRSDAWLTPDTPTLVDLPKGSSVLPSVEDLSKDLVSLPILSVNGGNNQSFKAYDDKAMRKVVSEVPSLLRTMIRQQHVDSRERQYEIFKSKI